MAQTFKWFLAFGLLFLAGCGWRQPHNPMAAVHYSSAVEKTVSMMAEANHAIE